MAKKQKNKKYAKAPLLYNREYQSARELAEQSIEEVWSSQLPSRAVGIANPRTMSGYAARDQQPSELLVTKVHEYGHIRDFERGVLTTEIGTDMFVTAATGIPADRPAALYHAEARRYAA